MKRIMTVSSGEENLIFKSRFQSGTDQRRVALSEILDAVTKAGIKLVLTIEELTLVIDEALTNAMEHGNHWNPQKYVSVLIQRDTVYLHFILEDEGSGFIPGDPPSEYEMGNKMSQRGRGISLIRKFCDPQWDDSGRLIDLPIKLL